MLIKTFALSVLALAAGAAVAQASDVVIDNYSTTGGQYGAGQYASDGVTTGQSFITGGTDLTLDAVVIPQLDSTDTDHYTQGETFAVYTDLFNIATGQHSPGVALPGTFVTSNSSNGQTTVDATSAPLLFANTRYWFVLSTNSTAVTSWDAPNIADPAYVPTYTHTNGWQLATDNYSAYETTAAGATTYFSYAADGPQFIYVQAVPEPSSLCLLGLAGAGAFVIVRRVRSAKAA